MAKRRRPNRWRPARRKGRMIEYDEEGRYLRHIALSEYRRIKRNERELRRLLRQGQTLQKALTIVFGCPLSAFVPGFFDLAEWFLLRDD